MKRVLIFSLNYYPRFIGGAEVAIKEITDRISPEAIEFHMVTLRFDSTLKQVEQVGNVLVHRIGFSKKDASIRDLGTFPLHLNKHWYQLGAYAYAQNLHRKYRYDAVWAMMAHSCGIPAGLFKAHHPKVKYLLTLQEGNPPQEIEQLMKPVMPLFIQAFTKADQLQAISTFLQKWGTRMGFKGEGVVIPNGVDVTRFTEAHSPSALTAMKEKLGKKDGDIYLVTTSRLVHKNGIDDVIRALPHLNERIIFLIYGIGPEQEKLKALSASLAVAHRVRFMGEIGHDAMPLALAVSDIFIRPSRSEGMGNSFIEAMAVGIPVIATQEGGIRDFLFDARRNPDMPSTGFAVDVDSPEQIAKTVEHILAEPEEVRETVREGKALVLQKYDWKHIAKQMEDLFASLLADRVK